MVTIFSFLAVSATSLSLFLRVNEVDSALDLLHQVGKLEYRVEKLLERDLLEIGSDCTADLGGDQDVHSAPAADQLEQLADIQLVGMH